MAKSRLHIGQWTAIFLCFAIALAACKKKKAPTPLPSPVEEQQETSPAANNSNRTNLFGAWKLASMFCDGKQLPQQMETILKISNEGSSFSYTINKCKITTTMKFTFPGPMKISGTPETAFADPVGCMVPSMPSTFDFEYSINDSGSLQLNSMASEYCPGKLFIMAFLRIN